MLRRLLASVLLLPLVAACSTPAAPTASTIERSSPSPVLTQDTVAVRGAEPSGSALAPTLYQGQALPTPVDQRPYPPPAWLVVGDRPVSASIGSYNNLEAPPLEEQHYIATVEVRPDAPVVLVLARGPVEEIEVATRPFGAVDSGEPMVVLAPTAQTPTELTLAPISVTQDQVLRVFVRFAPLNGIGGDAEYLWRLTPAR